METVEAQCVSSEDVAPIATYISAMDQLMVVTRRDLSPRSEAMDDCLQLLWHPYEPKLIGFQLSPVQVLLKHCFEQQRAKLPISVEQLIAAALQLQMQHTSCRYRSAIYEFIRGIAEQAIVPSECANVSPRTTH